MAKITKDMTFAEVLNKHPECAEVMMEHGLHCVGCAVASMETVEQGCKSHQMTDDQIEQMIEQMNAKISDSN